MYQISPKLILNFGWSSLALLFPSNSSWFDEIAHSPADYNQQKRLKL